MGTGGPKVLIVDDDAEVARAFARILTQRGYSTSIASDGRAALARVEAEAFNVVISDVSMPGMGGVELLQEMSRRNADLPVILITGGMPLSRTLDLLERGACQCLTKPILAEDLVRAVLRAAGTHRLALVRRESPELFGDRPNVAAAQPPRSASAMQNSWGGASAQRGETRPAGLPVTSPGRSPR